MISDVEKRLKVQVERIIRPIVAAENDKLKMRRELFAHAVEAYENEAATKKDSEEALKRSLARLGDPDATRTELQATVGWESRFNAYNDRILRRSEDTPLVWHAARVGFFTGSALLFALAVVLLPLEFREIFSGSFKGQLLVRMFLALSGMFGAGMFVGVLVTDLTWNLAERGYRRRGDFLLGGLAFLAASLALCVIGWCFTFVVARDYAASFAVLLQWLAFSAAIAPAFLVLQWLDIRQRRPLTEWLELDLSEAVIE